MGCISLTNLEIRFVVRNANIASIVTNIWNIRRVPYGDIWWCQNPLTTERDKRKSPKAPTLVALRLDGGSDLLQNQAICV